MDLVELYLRAVSVLLPKALQADIVEELRDVVLTRLETRADELGRPLTDDETEAVLRQVGHPLEVAAQYHDGPKTLIGPRLFPYYVFILKAALSLQAAIAVVVALIRLFTGYGDVGQAITHGFGLFFHGAVALVGYLTIAALVIEHQKLKIPYLDTWRVRDLSVLELATWDADSLRRWLGAAKVSPAERPPGGQTGQNPVAGIAFGLVAILWWTGAIDFGGGSVQDFADQGFDTAGLQAVDWFALRSLLFAPVLAYLIAMIVLCLFKLARPSARRAHAALRLGMSLLFLATLAWVWFLSPLSPAIRVGSIEGLVARFHAFLDSLSDSPSLAAGLTVLIALWAFSGLCSVATQLWRLVRPKAEVTT